MEAMHTQGPWRLDDHGAGCGNCIRFEVIEETHPSGRNPVVICEIEDTSIDSDGARRDDATACAARDLANARLIAAAPELLAACKALFELLNVEDHDYAAVTLSVREIMPMVRAAHAAIAKAEGR